MNWLSLGEAYRRASDRIDRREARLLLEHACGCSHVALISQPERKMTVAQADSFDSLIERRISGEPLAYLLGSAWFCGLEFTVTPDVLIPRPETETLVNLAVERALALEQPRIVDLGTGSGIVAIMLALRCPQAVVTAVDISAAALEVARVNAERHGVNIRFLEGDWFAPLGDDLGDERFDLIVSNPPYVRAGDPHLQENGLPFEPQQALTDGIGGGDGLDCIRHIIRGAPHHLQSNGELLLEHGYDQAADVRHLLSQAELTNVASWQDEAGIERVSGGSLESIQQRKEVFHGYSGSH